MFWPVSHKHHLYKVPKNLKHFYALHFASGLNQYSRYYESVQKKITTGGMRDLRINSLVPASAILINASYLGHMTTTEFYGKQDREKY